MGSGERRGLADSLRAEYLPEEREQMDPLSEGLARAFANRGLALNLPPSREQLVAAERARKSAALSELAAQAERAKQVQAQRKADLDAQRRAEAEQFEAKLNQLGMSEDQEQPAPAPHIPLNSGELLDRAAGQPHRRESAADLLRRAAERLTD